MSETAFAMWLEEQVTGRGWSYRELGRRADLSSGAISKVRTGAVSPTWEFCAKVAGALEMSAVDVFRAAGLLPAIAEERREELERVADLLAGLPEGPLYDETAAAIMAIAESARRRALEREGE